MQRISNIDGIAKAEIAEGQASLTSRSMRPAQGETARVESLSRVKTTGGAPFLPAKRSTLSSFQRTPPARCTWATLAGLRSAIPCLASCEQPGPGHQRVLHQRCRFANEQVRSIGACGGGSVSPLRRMPTRVNTFSHRVRTFAARSRISRICRETRHSNWRRRPRIGDSSLRSRTHLSALTSTLTSSFPSASCTH